MPKTVRGVFIHPQSVLNVLCIALVLLDITQAELLSKWAFMV